MPAGQYGVASVDIEGADQVAERAIKPCLLTQERDAFGLTIGFASDDCQAPPFDSRPPRVSLWSWPWSDWQGLNLAIVDADVSRIERFYRARGYYDAEVIDVRFEPASAGLGMLSLTEPPGGADPKPDACDPTEDDCPVAVTFVVDEGQPLRVGSVTLEGLDDVPAKRRAAIAEAELPAAGERFDELDYDLGKEALLERLHEAGYAAAVVEGRVQLDHPRKRAAIRYHVTPGRVFVFGDVRVDGEGQLPRQPIIAVAKSLLGERYRKSALRELQQEVYALGAFAAVEVGQALHAERREVDLLVTVRPLPDREVRLGVGVTAGTLQRTDNAAVQSVPQWDLHLFARYEERHVLGLGKLRIEERPRLVQQQQFPGFDDPQLGNLIRARLTQPGFLEPRTLSTVEAKWDYGPDPFQGFLRSDVFLRIGAKRAFLRRQLIANAALEFDRYELHEDAGSAVQDLSERAPRSYYYSFLEQDLRLDLRDDDLRPRAGVLLIMQASASIESPISDWSLIRLLPDLRAYIPLPFEASLALRFAAAGVFVLGSADTDAVGRTLGPYAFRLRGGGAQSNRGYLAGELGVGAIGGIRRWEATAELRLRLGEAWGVVAFFDAGNVTAVSTFGFRRPNPAAGFGFRYLTLVGTVRLDLGFRLDGLATPNRTDSGIAALEASTMTPYNREPLSKQWIFGAPGALHITIGEAF